MVLHRLKETLDGLARRRRILLKERNQISLPDDVPALDSLTREEKRESDWHLHRSGDVAVRAGVAALHKGFKSRLQSLLEGLESVTQRLRQFGRNAHSPWCLADLRVVQRGNAFGQQSPKPRDAVSKQHRAIFRRKLRQ